LRTPELEPNAENATVEELATVDQMKELNACGDVRFIYLFRNWVRFAVTASVTYNKFSIKITSLGR